MLNILSGVPLILSFLLYAKKRKDFVRQNIHLIERSQVEELHQRTMGHRNYLKFYERGLFALPGKVKPSFLIVGGSLVLLLVWLVVNV